MSEEFQTLTEGVKIHSLGTGTHYLVSSFGKVETKRSARYSNSEYATLLKEEWLALLDGKNPKILGYQIPKKSLAEETIHFLSPVNLGEYPQEECRKELTFWLLGNVRDLEIKTQLPGLRNYLEYIIVKDFEAKQLIEKRQREGFAD